MEKKGVYYILALVLVLLLFKCLFPAAQSSISQRAGELLGLDRNSERLIESMGDGLAEIGLHNSIITVFEEIRGGELYPADSMEK